MTEVTAQQFGRIWVRGDAPVEAWFRTRLFAAHGAKARFASKLRRLLPQQQLQLAVDERGLPGADAFRDVVAAASIVEAPWPLDWIFVNDYLDTERKRSLVFFFRRGEPRPFVVVKVRAHDAAGETLTRERAALESLRDTSFDSTIPSVVGFHSGADAELLALSVLEGTSMYAAMQNSIAPEKQVERYFQLAGTWLSSFQSARRGAHGDFWARNILVDRSSVAVVDWEHYDATADPTIDVFHFPLTFTLAIERRENRAAYSFRNGFAEPSVLSSAVRKWFSRFSALHSLSSTEMHERFVEHIRTVASSPDARPSLDSEDWKRILTIARDEQCVFSG